MVITTFLGRNSWHAHDMTCSRYNWAVQTLKNQVFRTPYFQVQLPIISSRGRHKVRDTALTNHWNVCNQHFTSISCKHRSNLDWFHSVSKKSLKGFGENWIWYKHINDFKNYVTYPRSTYLNCWYLNLF